jgi:hypothetical protein
VVGSTRIWIDSGKAQFGGTIIGQARPRFYRKKPVPKPSLLYTRGTRDSLESPHPEHVLVQERVPELPAQIVSGQPLLPAAGGELQAEVGQPHVDAEVSRQSGTLMEE